MEITSEDLKPKDLVVTIKVVRKEQNVGVEVMTNIGLDVLTLMGVLELAKSIVLKGQAKLNE